MSENGEGLVAEEGETIVDFTDLNPAYTPATEDSIVAVKFVGNTAQIGDFQTKNIDAFQLLALGQFLEMKGKQTIAAIEAEAFARAQAEARAREIVVPGRAPTTDELAKMPIS